MKKVFVALSGGVDSAVTAALLQERGYDVTGVFINIWQPEFLECTWKEDRLDAMRVAASLRIPFREIDLSDTYKKEVIDEMLEGYKSGVTPNPDVLCNRYIKFGALWDWAKKNGADMLATGHHARILKKDDGEFQLLRGMDKNKDQSYFLWQLNSDDLSHTIMPVGEMTKEKVRNLAKKYNLPVAKKPDSQGLCFVGHIDMHDFLKELLKTKPGKVLSENNEEIGDHDGAELYTLGQRHGFRAFENKTENTPKFVTSINVKKNTITVSKDKIAGATGETDIIRENWINGTPEESKTFLCQLRYRQETKECRVVKAEGKTKIRFKKSQVSTPGQSLVVYNEDVCLGGGIIDSK